MINLQLITGVFWLCPVDPEPVMVNHRPLGNQPPAKPGEKELRRAERGELVPHY